MPDVATLSDLYRFIVPEANIPQGQMLSALQQTARRFFDDTEVWRETLDPHNLVADEDEYILDWNWCSRVQRIWEVRWNTEAGITAGDKGTIVDVSQYDFDLPETLTFKTAPRESVTQGLEVDVIFVPTLQTCELPEWLLNRWAEAIWAGALEYLMAIPNKRWTNRERSSFWGREYRKFEQRALAEKKKMNKSGDIGFSA